MWRDTARYPRLVGPVDARVFLFMLIWLLHMSWLDLGIALTGVLIFSVLPFFGVSLIDAWRYVAQRISGRAYLTGEPSWKMARRARMG